MGGYVLHNGNDLLTSTVRTRHSETGIESQTGSDVTAVKTEGGNSCRREKHSGTVSCHASLCSCTTCPRGGTRQNKLDFYHAMGLRSIPLMSWISF